MFSIAYHKHPHVFYGIVLTAFLGGESSSTVRSWALCGLQLPLALKNFERVGNGSVMIFKTLQFQFSLTLNWDSVLISVWQPARVSHFHILLSGQIHPEARLLKVPDGISQHLPFLFPSSFIYKQETV